MSCFSTHRFLDAPVDAMVREASRLFITEQVSAARRAQVQGIVMTQMAASAGESGASPVTGIVPAVFSRVLRRLGLAAVAVGTIGDRRGPQPGRLVQGGTEPAVKRFDRGPESRDLRNTPAGGAGRRRFEFPL